MKLKLTIPKGSLEKGTTELLHDAFYKLLGQERTYRPVINDSDLEVKVLRPQEIPVYVAKGVFDLGITGSDWMLETGADVRELLDLEFGKVKVVAAIPKTAKASRTDDYLKKLWSRGGTVRLSTEYLNLASGFIKSMPSYRRRFGDAQPMLVTPWWSRGKNQGAQVYLSFGATEAKPPEDADLIVDVTETGTSLDQNNLKVSDVLLQSSARLIANRKAMKDAWKREKILNMMAMLKGVVEARKRVHIYVNVREENLPKLLKALPALKRPTIGRLSEEGWYAINTVVLKEDLKGLIPVLRRLAQGLVVHEPNQVLPLDEINEAVDLG